MQELNKVYFGRLETFRFIISPIDEDKMKIKLPITKSYGPRKTRKGKVVKWNK